MNSATEQLLNAVLGLPENDRSELIEALIAAQFVRESPIDENLLEIIERRANEVDSGLVKTLTWEVVQRRGREAING